MKKVYLKMESLQNTGSFKIRGMTNCFRVHEKEIREKGAVTLSAGNAGRSFAFLCGKLNVKSTVCMPNTVPKDRVRTIEKLGSNVELVPGVKLMDAVNRYLKQGMTLIHPFDDKDLIAGHGSIGLEILEDVKDLGKDDVVAVCCGGGGLVSGVAAALKLSLGRNSPRIVAVEPEGSACMSTSIRLNRPAKEPQDFVTKTIAHGLAPPFAGSVTFAHVKKFVDDVVTVSDKELVRSARDMYHHGFVCETSGVAAIAAAVSGKLGEKETRGRVICVVSGRNISMEDLYHELDEKAVG
jgi:threonine dehydratase